MFAIYPLPHFYDIYIILKKVKKINPLFNYSIYLKTWSIIGVTYIFYCISLLKINKDIKKIYKKLFTIKNS